MGPTWVLSAPEGPHVGPMNFAIWVVMGIHRPEDYPYKGPVIRMVFSFHGVLRWTADIGLIHMESYKCSQPQVNWNFKCNLYWFDMDRICISYAVRARVIHYSDVIMDTMASQITSLTTVCSTVYSGADQRKHQSSASLAFVRRIHRWAVNSPHKWPVTRKMFLFDDVIIFQQNVCSSRVVLA